MKLMDKSAIVTGGASGLGLATARELTAAGARVALLDIDVEGLDRATESLDGSAGFEVDVTDEDSVATAVRGAIDFLGAVHICVNAAGVATPGLLVRRGEPMDLAAFRRVVDVNLVGAIDVARRCALPMTQNAPDDGERGVIINISSGAAWQGQRGQTAYAASKAGLIGATLPMARDLARDGVRVVAIAPGLFDTAMADGFTPELRAQLEEQILNPSRLGRPSEIAITVRHTIENPYLNATTISIDAGVRLT